MSQSLKEKQSTSASGRSTKNNESLTRFLGEARYAFTDILYHSYLFEVPQNRTQLSSMVVRSADNKTMGIFFAPSNNVTMKKEDGNLRFEFARSSKVSIKALNEFMQDILNVCQDHKLDLQLSKFQNDKVFGIQAKSAEELMKLLKCFCDDFQLMTLDSKVRRLVLRKGQTMENLTVRFLREVLGTKPGAEEISNPFIPDPAALASLPATPFLNIHHAYVAAIRGIDRGTHGFSLDKVELPLREMAGSDIPEGMGLKMIH